MPEPDFTGLEKRLLDGGIAASHARRITAELAEHYRDLCDEAQGLGLAGDPAIAYALERLGRETDIAAAVFCRPELKSWIYRYPAVARVVLPLACLTLLPAVPLIAGVNHAPLLVRWGACLMLSGLFTAALMLTLYLTIVAI